MDRINMPLKDLDPEIYAAIQNETRRQANGLELIASENCTSEAVLEATGSIFTNKYAEGYPGRRYYGGCEFVDVVENLAIERAKRLFGAVELARRRDRTRQRHRHLARLFPLRLLKPDHPVRAALGLLECANGHLRRRHTQHRERPPQRAFVRRNLVCHQRLIQPRRARRDVLRAPIAPMPP